ncbi:MAG TPA: ABC transporter ATP-binding protein [Thiobacillaceae bacterium]|nr:ABC transporter ATP-binding protein [Thiobacillaceae bacterium]HNU65435.1 ABC transporter ATP-binding protein [Thiobacillaceae bacterium]
MSLLEARGLAIGYRGRRVGGDIDLCVATGEVLCLLGPNGGGKTTLFRTLLGVLPPLAGVVTIAGRPLRDWSRLELARQIGYVPQAHAGLFAFTVEDVALMGRTARMGRFSSPSPQDRAAVGVALARLGIAHLAGRIYTEISGGERQLVLIARALAQEAKMLILDEPTASLDFGNQLRVLGEIERLKRDGIAILMSTHQPEHAFKVADRLALLKTGQIVAQGMARATATPERLAVLYEADVAAVAACLPATRGKP